MAELNDLVFTENNGEYVSDAIQLTTGTIGIQLKFNGQKETYVNVEQSLDGVNFLQINTDSYVGKNWYKNATGGVIGQYIRIKSNNNPLSAKYLESE